MNFYTLEYMGDDLVSKIKNQPWFPFKSGNLKYHATFGNMYDSKTYRIHFSGTVAPYVEYLEEGTKPHDIPHAFGKDLPFGVGGRFDGKFHPGSTKHKGFIKDKSVMFIVNYIATKYEGEIEVL